MTDSRLTELSVRRPTLPGRVGACGVSEHLSPHDESYRQVVMSGTYPFAIQAPRNGIPGTFGNLRAKACKWLASLTRRCRGHFCL
jgi:hypothetical protein